MSLMAQGTSVTGGWRERVLRVRPDFTSKLGWTTGGEELAGEGFPLLQKDSWNAYHSSMGAEVWVMDSACNKSLAGELTLRHDEKDLAKRFGLGAVRRESREDSTSGGGSKDVCECTESAVRPVGIRGLAGEIEFVVIPGADTPCLISRGDLEALKTDMKYGSQECKFEELEEAFSKMPQGPGGHYLMSLNDFPEGGRWTPTSVRQGRPEGGVCGPILTICDANAESEEGMKIENEDCVDGTDAVEGGEEMPEEARASPREEASEESDESKPEITEEPQSYQGFVFQRNPGGIEEPYVGNWWSPLRDGWKKMRAENQTRMPFLWTGTTWFGRTNGRWGRTDHSRPRYEFITPSHLGAKHEWSGRRITCIAPVDEHQAQIQFLRQNLPGEKQAFLTNGEGRNIANATRRGALEHGIMWSDLGGELWLGKKRTVFVTQKLAG